MLPRVSCVLSSFTYSLSLSLSLAKLSLHHHSGQLMNPCLRLSDSPSSSSSSSKRFLLIIVSHLIISLIESRVSTTRCFIIPFIHSSVAWRLIYLLSVSLLLLLKVTWLATRDMDLYWWCTMTHCTFKWPLHPLSWPVFRSLVQH